MNEALSLAAEKAGSWAALARVLGVRHQPMYRWRNRGFLPPKRALQIEAKYGIPAKDLIEPALADLVGILVA